MKNEIAYDKKNAFVVDTTAIQVKVKKIVIDDLISGKPKDVTDKQVTKVVDEFVRHIKSPSIRERYMRTIAENYRKWYSTFAVSVMAVKAFEKTNERLIQAANTKGFGGVVFNFNTRNFRTSEDRATVVIEDYKNKVKKAYSNIVKELSKDELKEFTGGTLRNYAEIRVRWEANRDDIERLKADGVTHVWASSHANCSERCSHWQGKLYSLYDESGVLDGISFQPLSEAMRGKKNDGNGLLGYNCRHRIIPYFKGSTAPKEYTKEQIEKASEIDKQQRYMERKIRKKKEDAYLLKGVDNKLSKELFGQARELTEEYREYSETNNRPAYIYRTQIMREEVPVLKELKNNSKDDIIKLAIKGNGIRGEINLEPKAIDVNLLSFDNQHTNIERNHDVTFEEAKSYISNAKVSVTTWKGKFENYYSEQGVVSVNMETNTIRTAYKTREFDEKTKNTMEMLKKNGR